MIEEPSQIFPMSQQSTLRESMIKPSRYFLNVRSSNSFDCYLLSFRHCFDLRNGEKEVKSPLVDKI